MKPEIIFRVKVLEGYHDAGKWAVFEVEDLFESMYDKDAHDWTTKSRFINRTDFKENKIFEGDILRLPTPFCYDRDQGEVIYTNYHGLVTINKEGIPICKVYTPLSTDIQFIEDFERAEIVDNIYDHPKEACVICDYTKITHHCRAGCPAKLNCDPSKDCPFVLESKCPGCAHHYEFDEED